MSGCSILTLTEYKERHDNIGNYIYWKICKNYEIPKSEKKNSIHQLESVTEAKEDTFLWDLAIQTDRKIKSNKPDQAVKNYKRKISSKWYFSANS